MNKIKSLLKRALSFILALVILLSNAIPSFAQASDLGLPSTGANQWQIVDKQYAGNGQDQKQGWSSLEGYDDVWIQKNVVPTDVENEFKVYLSITKRAGWDELLEQSALLITTSNKYHSYPLGWVTDASNVVGNAGNISPNPNYGPNSYPVTVYYERNGQVVYTYSDTYYGTVSNCSNATGFIVIGDKAFLATRSVSLHGDQTVTFTIDLDTLEENGVFYLVPPAQLKYVNDILGNYLIYQGVEYSDGTVSYDSTNHSLHWDILENANVIPTFVTNPVTGYYYNIAQLVYKVKLDVTKTGFNSCADNMNSAVGDPESYFTNEEAKLYYQRHPDGGSSTTTYEAIFQKPAVRGLLYDLKIRKVDQNGNVLVGDPKAKFKVTDSSDTLIKEDLVDANGLFEVRNLPWGTYTIEETAVPFNFPFEYEAAQTTYTVTLCWTTNPDDLVQSDVLDNKMYKGNSTDNFFNITNNAKLGHIKISKILDTNVTGYDDYEFKIEISLDRTPAEGAPQPVSGTFNVNWLEGLNTTPGTITFDAQGKATTFLKGGQTLEILNLPADCTCSVEEKDIPLNFEVEYSTRIQLIEKDLTKEIDITNKYHEYNFNILKKDKVNDENLSGVGFTLYKSNEDWEELEQVGLEKLTDLNGLVSFEGLFPGKYLLKETTVLDGYIAEVSTWRITFANDGTVTIATPADETLTPSPDPETDIDTYTIYNTPGFELPTTGGEGISAFRLTGAMIVIVTLILMGRQRRLRCEK